jgi:sugar/nucleoside kinase (ribokinase family)
MRYDVITGGYVSLDRIIKITSSLGVGFTSLVENSDNAKIYYGGCSINIAYHLARLGLRTLPIVRVGRDFEESGFRDFLSRGNVCLDAIETVAEDMTPNCYLLEDPQGQHVTVFYPGAQGRKYYRPMKKEFFQDAGLGVMTVGSEPDNLEFFRKCRDAGIRMVFGMKADFDAYPDGVLKEALLYSSVIFTNESERQEMEKRLGIGSLTELLKSGNLRIIVTTRGTRGSVYYERAGERIVSGEIFATPCRGTVDTTGSGDGYISGFLYGYLRGYDTESCCRLGSTMASFIIESMGCCTGAPDEGELMRRFNKEDPHGT